MSASTPKTKRPSLEVAIDAALTEPLKNPTEYASSLFGDAIAAHRVSVCYVANKFSHFARLANVSLGGIVEGFLDQHEVREDKHHTGLIFADLKGKRKDIFAESVCAAVYDIDDLMSFEEVAARRAAHFGPTFTTHSHGRTRASIPEGEGRIFLVPQDFLPFTVEAAARLLPKFRDVRPLNGGEPVEGRYHFEHAPTQRSRAVIFFNEPVLLSDLKQDGWRALYDALGHELFGPMFDTSCKNPARIHWCPAHPPGAPHEVRHAIAPLYDWRPLWERIKSNVEARRETARARANEALTETPADLAELAHVLKSIPPDLKRPEWFKVLAALHHETKGSEEGRALAHQWSAGAPSLYDPDDIDMNIWSYFDQDRTNGPTMGTLVWLAQQHDPKFTRLSNRPIDLSHLAAARAARKAKMVQA